jgi:uncharacterized protein (DUF1499 family)
MADLRKLRAVIMDWVRISLPRRRWLMLLVAAPWIPVAILAARNPGNVAVTAPDHADARLRTRHYSGELSEAHRVLRTLIPQQKTYGLRWKLTETSPHQLKVEVPVLIFTDDLTINLREDEAGVLVDVVSRSRVGKSDLGENGRHILQLLAALDEYPSTL